MRTGSVVRRSVGFLCFVFLSYGSATAFAAVPSAGQILEKTQAWSAELPAVARGYRLEISRDTREPRVGRATLTASRMLETEEASLRESRALRLWEALIRGQGQSALGQVGVDTQVTSLYHLNRRVVVIVGALPMQPDAPQVWFDRDTGAPVRVIYVLPGQGREVLTMGSHDLPGTLGFFPGTWFWEDAHTQIFGQLIDTSR